VYACISLLFIDLPLTADVGNLFAKFERRTVFRFKVNRLMGTSSYSAISNNMKLVHWPLMGGLLHLVQR